MAKPSMIIVLLGIALITMAVGGDRSYTAGRFALEVDGQIMGYVKNVSGGFPKANVVTQHLGPENIVKKHIANITYEPITLETDLNMSPAFYDWIKQSMKGESRGRNGAILALDGQNAEIWRHEFVDGLITEISFPKLDASSKDPAYLTIEVTPRTTMLKRGSGDVLKSTETTSAKAWLASNFRLEIDGFDAGQALAVDSFHIQQKVAAQQTASRLYTNVPGKLEASDLKITIAMADMQPWYDWLNEHLENGKCGCENEVSASIVYLAPDLKAELGRIDLRGVGIYGLTFDVAESGADEAPTASVSLYVEQVDLFVK